jgi:hypothetical protein
MAMFVRLTDDRIFELNHWTNFDEIGYENCHCWPLQIYTLYVSAVGNNIWDAPLPW